MALFLLVRIFYVFGNLFIKESSLLYIHKLKKKLKLREEKKERERKKRRQEVMGGGGVGGSGGSGDDGTGGFLLSPLRAKKKNWPTRREKRISSWVYKDDAAVGEKKIRREETPHWNRS